MRKLYLLAVASTLLFACSKNDSNEPTTPPVEGIVFELATVNELESGITSRTRPLYSQEAIQQVSRVSIHSFKLNGPNYLYDTTYIVPNWSVGSSFMRFPIAKTNERSQGDYQFLVIGQEATDFYTITTPVKGTTKVADMVATITAPGMESEIFAGTQTASVTSAGVRVSVQMTRKIAGILAYFKNVPAELSGKAVKTLRLTISNTDKLLNLYSGTGDTPTGTSYDVFNVDLSGQTITPEGVYNGNDLSAPGVIKVANSQLFGSFLLPVGNITMTLGLYDATNNPLKTWTVTDGVSTTFNITANNFYSLGQKVAMGDTNGGGTPDPGDDDAPIDLLRDQVIAITINANWAQIHNLTIQ